jgi:uncharacterized protein YjbJ (UPF0337 family)
VNGPGKETPSELSEGRFSVKLTRESMSDVAIGISIAKLDRPDAGAVAGNSPLTRSQTAMAINAQELQGQWTKLRGQVKEKWGQLTDDDLQMHGGNIDQLVGKIQQRTGEGRESIERYLTELTSRGSSAIANAADAVGQYAQHAGDRLRDQYGHLSDQARERFDQAQDVVRHNPAQSVMAAFGIGLVAGLVVGLAIRSR